MRRMLFAAQSDDFYFDSFPQVQMPIGLRVGSRLRVTPDTAHHR